jgi:hypothetical protein
LLFTLGGSGFELGFFGSSSSLSQVKSTQLSSAFVFAGFNFMLDLGKSSVIISEKVKEISSLLQFLVVTQLTQVI